jgi:pimeloyl-ACP methyl ester carboxylesterase
MSDAQFVVSSDGARIAYDVTGSEGPPLVLLHGFTSHRREAWHDLGWVARLQDAFTVITVDLRGCGESESSTDPAFYAPDRHWADLDAILAACGATQCALFGISWGATVARNAAAAWAGVTRVVLAGTYFGQIFTEEFLAPREAYFADLARKVAAGQVDDLTPEQRDFAAQTDLDVMVARHGGLRLWPGVDPDALRCPALVYTGSEDGNVVKVLTQQRDAITAAGHRWHCFEGLDHGGLVAQIDTVAPVVVPFLQA